MNEQMEKVNTEKTVEVIKNLSDKELSEVVKEMPFHYIAARLCQEIVQAEEDISAMNQASGLMPTDEKTYEDLLRSFEFVLDRLCGVTEMKNRWYKALKIPVHPYMETYTGDLLRIMEKFREDMIKIIERKGDAGV